MCIALFLVATMAVAAAGTGWLRGFALQHAMLDVPNERSSHACPTPRGGGAAVAAISLLAVTGGWMFGRVPADLAISMTGGGLAVAAVGYFDDRGHVPAHWRLLVHLAAGCWVVAWMGPAAVIPMAGLELDLGIAAWALGVIGVAWMINLYNFMDGIDGIAGVEAVTVTAGAALLLWQAGAVQLALVASTIGAASAGFLAWNWPPAKIFLGDVGSGFLGFSFGAIALMSSAKGSLVLWPWLILLGVFLVDASLTLIRRLLRGERIYEAHRNHAYQRAARRWGGHLPVAAAVGVINIIWLLPLAAAATRWPEWGVGLLAIAWSPLIAGALLLGAGSR